MRIHLEQPVQHHRSRVQLELAAPDGWTVQPSSDDELTNVRAGDTVQRSWQVTGPNDGGATGRTVDLTFSASEDGWKFCALLAGPAEQS